MFAIKDKVYHTGRHMVGTIKKIGSDVEMTYLVRFRDGTLAWLSKDDKYLQAAKTYEF